MKYKLNQIILYSAVLCSLWCVIQSCHQEQQWLGYVFRIAAYCDDESKTDNGLTSSAAASVLLHSNILLLYCGCYCCCCLNKHWSYDHLLVRFPSNINQIKPLVHGWLNNATTYGQQWYFLLIIISVLSSTEQNSWDPYSWILLWQASKIYPANCIL